MKSALTFPGFQIEVGGDWGDITDSLDSANSPFTVAKRDGVGALQFTAALYKSGPLPCPSKDDLLAMAVEFGQKRILGEPFDVKTFDDKLVGAGTSYHSEDDFIRVWYVSDGKNIMFATYVSDWKSRDQ